MNAPIRGLTPSLTDPFMVCGNGCKWPYGDPGARGFHFCGRPREIDDTHRWPDGVKPYCPRHCAIAYRASKG